MAVHGFVTHAAQNRRRVFFLALLYVVAFEIIGAFAMVFPLLVLDDTHTPLSDPLGYFLRYGLAVAGLSIILFGWLLADHADAVARDLGVRVVERRDEPRFVRLGEEACTTQGVRAPRFGVIEANAPNALSAGEGARGLIVVTRGLLDLLDDDELASVLAHEAAHIRHGDTASLAANDALMRTAQAMQRLNPLRIEDSRQLILLMLPPIAVILLASGALTMFALGLARYAGRGVKLARDHIADGEAVRATHFPEALISALRKIAGRGAFSQSSRHEPLLFDGAADREGGSHPSAEERIAAIATLARDLMNPRRGRIDTRVHGVAPRFGRRQAAPVAPGSFATVRASLTVRNAWTADDGRNVFGIKREMMLPVALTLAASFGLMIYMAKDGEDVLHALNPARYAEVVHEANKGVFCSGFCGRPPRNDAELAAMRAAPQESLEGPPEPGVLEKLGHVSLTGVFVALFMWRRIVSLKRMRGGG